MKNPKGPCDFCVSRDEECLIGAHKSCDFCNLHHQSCKYGGVRASGPHPRGKNRVEVVSEAEEEGEKSRETPKVLVAGPSTRPNRRQTRAQREEEKKALKKAGPGKKLTEKNVDKQEIMESGTIGGRPIPGLAKILWGENRSWKLDVLKIYQIACLVALDTLNLQLSLVDREVRNLQDEVRWSRGVLPPDVDIRVYDGLLDSATAPEVTGTRDGIWSTMNPLTDPDLPKQPEAGPSNSKGKGKAKEAEAGTEEMEVDEEVEVAEESEEVGERKDGDYEGSGSEEGSEEGSGSEDASGEE